MSRLKPPSFIARSLVLLSVAIFIASTIISLMPPKKVDAAYADLPEYLNSVYDQYISLEPNDPVTGKGNYTPSFRFILYSPTGSTSDQVEVTNVSTTNKPRCGNFSISKAAVLNDNQPSGETDIASPATVVDPGDCVNTTTGFIIRNLLDPGGYGNSSRFPGYKAIVIRLALKAGENSVFADISTRGANDRLSYMGKNVTPSQAPPLSADGVSMSIPQGSGSTIVQKFAPPCNTNGDRAFIWWKDADSNDQPNSNNPVRFEVREFAQGYSNGYRTIDSGDAGNGGQHYRSSFIPKKGAKYEIRFTGVQARTSTLSANTIKVWSPYDSGAAYVDCPDDNINTPPCVGSWSYNVSNDSFYKFSFFDRQPSVTNPSPTDKSSGASREWATTSGAANLKTDYHNSNSGNYSTSLPNQNQYLGGWVLIERWHDYDSNSNGTNDRMDYGRTHDVIPMCATASCSNVTVTGPIAGTTNGVPAGSQFNIEVDYNGVNAPGNLAGQNLSIIVDSPDWGGAVFPIGHGIGSGAYPWQSGVGNLSFTMPNDRIPRNLHVYIGYPNLGNGRIDAAGCGTPVIPYQYFNLTHDLQTPQVDDDENPSSITANATINRQGTVGPPIFSGSLAITRNGSSVRSVPVSAPAGTNNVDFQNVYNSFPGGNARAAGWQVGDRICSLLNYNYQSGWWGPDGYPIVGPPQPGTEETCIRLTNKPYVSVYGNDVSAGGGGLGQPCSTAQSNISAYSKQGGSGTQLAAYANGSIGQFKTAFLRSPSAIPNPINAEYAAFPTLGTPTLPDGLKFSSYGAVDCATDYYTVDQFEDGDTRKKAFNGSTLNVGAPGLMQNGEQTVSTPPGGQLRLNGSTNFTGKHTIFVDGDVYITSNITYASTSWANIDAIPYFNLVVKGNIYIDPNVTQLDGRYIAQKRNDDVASKPTGIIYTCAPSGDASPSGVAGGYLWNNCGGAYMTNPGSPGRKLTVNGQFIARAVAFRRTINTLSDGTFKERQTTSKAAEIFNFSPEMYLARPAVRPTATSTSGEYEYITTLPPIL